MHLLDAAILGGAALVGQHAAAPSLSWKGARTDNLRKMYISYDHRLTVVCTTEQAAAAAASDPYLLLVYMIRTQSVFKL